MYESFFDLSSRPFPAAPAIQYYFPTAVVEQARQTLIRIVDRAEGPGLIIGQPGLGKTLLLQMLEHHFQNVFHCIHLTSAAIETRKDLLQNVLFELDLPYRNMEEGELRLSLLDFLRPSDSCPHGVLLLVDEAHTLPLQLLDEIRMITNLVRDGQPRVRLVLAGDAQLDDVFADPRLDSFNQRIAARCYLEPLNQEQTIEYVQAQIASIGGEPSGIFTPDSLVAVYRASGGIPRLINQVCDHALVMASLGGYHQLDAAGIEEAWADLQQLPGPWNQPAEQSHEDGSSIVEFGSLDGDEAVASSPVDQMTGPATDVIEHRIADATDSDRFVEATDLEIGNQFDATDPAPVDSLPDAVATEAQVESGSTGEDAELETLPAADHEGPGEVASPTIDLGQTFQPLSSFESELPSDATANYFESNVSQVGWDGNVLDASVLASSGLDANVLDSHVLESKGQESNGQESNVQESNVQESNVLDSNSPVTNAPAPPLEATPSGENTPEFVDPFGQGFEEEEVVIDRYGDHGGSVFSGCPRVSSEEGRALAAIIEKHSRPQLSVLDLDADAAHDEAGDNTESPVASVDDHGQVEVEVEVEAERDVVADETQQSNDELTKAAELTAQALANNVFDTSSVTDWPFESTTDAVAAGGIESDSNAHIDDETPPAVTNASSVEDVANALDTPQQAASAQANDDLEPSFLQVHDGPHINDDRDMILIDDDKHNGVFDAGAGDDLARRVEYQQLFSQLREG